MPCASIERKSSYHRWPIGTTSDELQHINLLRKDSFGRMPEECVWLRQSSRSYPKDITKHKLAARKKTSLITISPVDQRLHLIACCRCPSMTLSRSAMS